MKYILTFTFTLFTPSLLAQSGIMQVGSRAAGMAYASSTLTDSWAAFNNPGGLGSLEGTTAMFSFENKYNIDGFNTVAAGMSTSMSIGSLGLTVFKFGDDLYNEQIASLSYGNKFGITALGARINYIQYHIEGFGDKGALTIDFGGIAEITNFLYFGAYIRNINQAKLAELEDEHVPTVLNAGLSYRPSNKIMVNLETEKDIDYEPSFRAGLEYMFLEKFIARTGIRTQPFTNFFGLGFKTAKLTIDYALSHDLVLGNSHQAAISYRIKK